MRAGYRGAGSAKAHLVRAKMRLARLREMLERIERPTLENADAYVEDRYRTDPQLLRTDIARLENRTTRI
jgi:hypothetical protein